jgi:F-type H+-transporting ATPase subunit b
MEETLRQLGGLLLGAIPTVIFMLLMYGIYSVLVHRPLTKVLAERRSRTEGAVEKARSDIAAAEARTAEYEQKLREARTALFKMQEARRQQSLQARAAVVAQARARSQAEIAKAKEEIYDQMRQSKAGLEAEAGSLASAIIRTVLRPAGVAAGERG